MRHSGGAAGSPGTRGRLARQEIYDLSHGVEKEQTVEKHGPCDHISVKRGTKQQARERPPSHKAERGTLTPQSEARVPWRAPSAGLHA